MSRKPRQSSFKGDQFKPKLEFGGSLNKNSNPKVARSVSTKHAMHVVLRSDVARGPFSLLKRANEIRAIIDKQADKFAIKIYEKAVVSNHIHLLIYLKANDYVQGKKALSRFLKALSGLIARLVLGRERGKGQKYLASKLMKAISSNEEHKQTNRESNRGKPIKFWAYRPYTRVVVGFKRGYQVAKDYVVQNHLEAIGVIAYQPRKLRQSSA